jgi:hypothetical protein
MYLKYLPFILPLFIGMDPNSSSQRRHNDPKPTMKQVTDKIIKHLVIDGICSIDNYTYEQIKDTLPEKLRGITLFHCDIKSKTIFITYTKIYD